MLDFDALPDVAPDYDLRDLLEAGCHFGHQKAKGNPRMKPYIHMEKDGVHIFDLAQTASQLKKAYNAAYHLAKNGKTMVVVGTKKQASPIVEEVCKDNNVMYISSRWLGGMLTNWDQVKKSLQKMRKTEKGLVEGTYKGLTKYEKLQLEKEVTRLKRFFGGVEALKEKPDCLFVIDPKRERIAVTEAKNVNIPVMAIVDSNGNPETVNLVIPANDDAQRSVKFLLTAVVEGYTAGLAAK